MNSYGQKIGETFFFLLNREHAHKVALICLKHPCATDGYPIEIQIYFQEGVMNLGLGTKEMTDDRLTRALRPS